MSKRWRNAKNQLPEYDPVCPYVSYEVIVETKDGSQLWAYCQFETGQWYRTDGNPVDNVKRWRYANGYEPVSESFESDNV